MSEESTPENPQICPSCGEPVPADAPAGLCPKCVLGAAAQPTGSGDDTIPLLRFDAPKIDEIATAFPTLEILELIGCGGMGAVYKARQPHLDREVALKILPHSLAETPEFTERFLREGRLLARLNHPNIVGVYDFGESGGYFFLLMEFVDGVNLRQAMAAGKFLPEQALEIVPEVCEALQFAHNEGILHRDIKPENILLDTKGRVKIADFGIAKMVGEVGAQTITRTAAPGTPQYMAPEQIEQPGDVDHRADIYSLGVVFYEMLTGELPIGRFAAPSEKAEVGTDVDDIVFRALEKERDRRQQSADEVRTEISGVPPLHRSGIADARSSANGTLDARIHPGRVLMMTVAGVFFPLLMLWLAIAVSDFESSKYNWEIQPLNAVHNRVINLPNYAERQLAAAKESFGNDHPEISRLENELNIVRNQETLFEEKLNKSHNSPKWSTLPAMIAFWAFLAICAIPTTILGWRQLFRLKILQQKRGRVPSLIAAWAWPMGAIVVLISFIVLILSNGNPTPGVVALISLLCLAAGWWSVINIWRFLNQAATEKQIQRFEQQGGTANQIPPLLNRYLLFAVVILGAITLILIVSSAIVYEGRERANLLGICALLSALGTLVATVCFANLVNGSYFPAKENAAGGSHNPWPRRIFWMIALIVFAPATLVVISVAVPNLPRQASADPEYLRGLHGVGIGAPESNGDYHSIDLTTVLRKPNQQSAALLETNPVKMEIRVVYEGPGVAAAVGDGNRLHPGDTIEWTQGTGTKENRKIEFFVPDEAVREKMFTQLAQFKQKAGPTVLVPDIRRLDLFKVRVNKVEYRAMLEIEIVTR